jgi:SOS response associated peptidase (SRAP)
VASNSCVSRIDLARRGACRKAKEKSAPVFPCGLSLHFGCHEIAKNRFFGKSAPVVPQILPLAEDRINLWKKALQLSLFATNKAHGGNVWFAFDGSRPLAFFAGLHVPQWTSVRKAKEGETTNDLFAFLTTEPNDVVAPVHPKAMPVILTTEVEREAWMTAPAEDALKLQRPLRDGMLQIVATGEKDDAVTHEAA